MGKNIVPKNGPVRVLHVLTGLKKGGAESFIMNMYRHMEHDKVQFDFLLRSEDNVYREELEQSGSNVYVTATFPRHFLKNALETEAFFREHTYDVVHVHANALLYMFAIKSARRNGIKHRIIHSHNSAMAHMKLLPIHQYNKQRISKYATDCFACSQTAGRWMFNGDFTVVKNAIDTKEYAYDPAKRKKIRYELGIKENEFVVGHVGRFVAQKNHEFLIDIFNELHKTKPASKLVMAGSGERIGLIKEKVQSCGLDANVLFLGDRTDIDDLLNAFDIFVMPSLYEGLSIALVEAQTNGLPIICSSSTSEEALFDKNAKCVALSKSAREWADIILNENCSRRDTIFAIRNSGFDIHMEAKKLERFYLSCADTCSEGKNEK